ncbi:MAG: sigma-70 family RNA polymerase sigma factor [Planctomycetes bacterium]|nr:sigma-70 family RNA polymerase sigma factor [Planctomycetota bacterium]
MPELDLDTLWRDHGVDLQRFLRVLGASHAEAEDATQEVFLQALRTPPAPGNTAAWLRTVAKNAFLKSVRKTRKIVPLDMQTIEQDWAAVAGDDGAQGKVEALKRCIAGLDEREKQILHMRYTLNYSREQLGEALSLSDGGVKNLLERVKYKLKACVERQG